MALKKIFFKSNCSSWRGKIAAAILGVFAGAAGSYYTLDNYIGIGCSQEEESAARSEKMNRSLERKVRDLSGKIASYESNDYLPRFKKALDDKDEKKVVGIFEAYLAGCRLYYPTGMDKGREFCAVTLENALNHMFNLNDSRTQKVYGSVLEILKREYGGITGTSTHPFYLDDN